MHTSKQKSCSKYTTRNIECNCMLYVSMATYMYFHHTILSSNQC